MECKVDNFDNKVAECECSRKNEYTTVDVNGNLLCKVDKSSASNEVDLYSYNIAGISKLIFQKPNMLQVTKLYLSESCILERFW